MPHSNGYASFGGYSAPFYGYDTSQIFTDRPQYPTSPVPSVLTARSAPMSHPRDPMNLSDTHVTRTESANPLLRFYQEDPPWSAVQLRGFNAPLFPPPHHNPGPYPCSIGSEVESQGQPSDSGYQTASNIGNEINRIDYRLPIDGKCYPDDSPVTSNHSLFSRGPQSTTENTSQYSARSGTRGAKKAMDIGCPTCSEMFRCKSDLKKHMRRHNKPYVCTVHGCRRAGKGFTTPNDLDRHKKSVHQIGAHENSFQCASENCKTKGKVWPRLDNFKSHLYRMHRDEDQAELIRRSCYQPEDSMLAIESVASVTPMETQLAGTGTGLQFSEPSNSTETDDPESGIRLTPHQATLDWSTGDLNDFGTQQRELTYQSDHVTPGYSRGDCEDFISSIVGMQQSTRLAGEGDRSGVDLGDPVCLQPSYCQSPCFSTAPQTKSEQQNFSQKPPEDTTEHMHDTSNDNQDAIQNTLRRTQTISMIQYQPLTPQSDVRPSQGQRMDTLPTLHSLWSEALAGKDISQATEALTASLKTTPDKRDVQPPRQSTSPQKKSQCTHCSVTARACELRKHMKRHTRPYGCTYPSCFKRFGAKSDWKRHENTRHFQPESWLCQLPHPRSMTSEDDPMTADQDYETQQACYEVFSSSVSFTSHINTVHNLTQSSQVADELQSSRLGGNYQGSFWCGFCKSIIALQKKRNEAWTERFDHIDAHFMQEGKAIGDWFCVGERRYKAFSEMRWEAIHEENDEIRGNQKNVDRGVRSRIAMRDTDTTFMSPSVQTPSISSHTSNKRAPKQSSHRPPLPRPLTPPSNTKGSWNISRYCCACGDGPWGDPLNLRCLQCDHTLCGKCAMEREFVDGDL